jgi:hypothetical protein
MDNIVSIEEQSNRNCITTIDLWRLPCLRVLLLVKVSMTELKQWKRLTKKKLDDTFTTDLEGI